VPFGEVLESEVAGIVGRSRVADPGVDRPEFVHCALDDGGDRVGLCDVGNDLQRLLTTLGDPLGNFIKFVLAACRQDDGCTGIGEGKRDSAADATSGAGDDGDHSVHPEQIHDVCIGRVDRRVRARHFC
jgi:hypothetical protein